MAPILYYFGELADEAMLKVKVLRHHASRQVVKQKGDPVAIGVAVASEILHTSVDVAVDPLRLGRGVKKGGFGYVQDGLRLVIVGGMILRATNAVSRTVVAFSKARSAGGAPGVLWAQQAGATNCTVLSTLEAVRASGNGVIPIRQLYLAVAKKAGTTLENVIVMYMGGTVAGTYAAWFRAFGKVLSKCKISHRFLNAKSLKAVEDLVMAARGDAFVVSYNYSIGAKTFGHSVVMTRVGNAIKIIDPACLPATFTGMTQYLAYLRQAGAAGIKLIETYPILQIHKAGIGVAKGAKAVAPGGPGTMLAILGMIYVPWKIIESEQRKPTIRAYRPKGPTRHY